MGRDLAVSGRTYRWIDRATKLGGIALIAAGLEVGGTTVAGTVLGVAGVALGLTTVFLTND